MKIAIIIPSYNPTKKIVKLVNELQKDFDNIFYRFYVWAYI